MAGAYSREAIDANEHHRTIPQNAKQAEIAAQVGDSHLENIQYARLMTDYLKCTQMFVGSFVYPAVMEQQLQRTDLDTVCAYELYQMKKHFCQGDTLDYKNFLKQD